jgi:beta-glucosidase/6-phospho-beta-glucosidase/beta-galactosidase
VEHFAGFKKPIYILENGVPDREDRIRPWAIESIVRQMHELLAKGIDLRGYFHWTLADNFEWNEGWHLRFGLYELDPATQIRKPRSSAQVYQRMIKQSSGKDPVFGPFASETPDSAQNRPNLAAKEIDSGSCAIVTENESTLGD